MKKLFLVMSLILLGITLYTNFSFSMISRDAIRKCRQTCLSQEHACMNGCLGKSQQERQDCMRDCEARSEECTNACLRAVETHP